MIIDSFAGGGGASTGIELALGRSPDVAINHNAKALAMHEANHPETLHLDSNIWDVDPQSVTQGRHVGLLWASPDCKHFSKAKGGAPRDRNVRDLAWVVVKWAEEVKPDVILMENVEEFVTWGPIGEDGQPIKEFAGLTFNDWKRRLRRAGYRISDRELRGCDYGAPTIRKRWFFVARRDGRPIVWPKPTHGDPKTRAVQKGKLKPWRTAAECINWSLPCPSIFDNSAEIKQKHGLRAVRPLAKNTMARVARGLKRYVLDAENPFLVQQSMPLLSTFYGHNNGRGKRAADLQEPLRTVTVQNRHALISPSITRFNSGATGQDIRDPLATITANSLIKRPGGTAPIGIITPTLVNVANSKTTGRGPNAWSIQEALRTITSSNGFCLVAPSLLSLKGTARRDMPVNAPHPTILAGGNHSALIAPVLTYAQQGGRNRPVTAPHHTICASRKDQNALIVPTLVQTGYGERKGQEPRALNVRAPLGTVVAGGIKHAAVAPWLLKYYGTGDGARSNVPCHTITARDRFGHTQADLATVPAFEPAQEAKARAVADLMRSHGYWGDGEFVTLEIDGETFVIVDIGMRMLSPRELFNAQGFPADYVIEGTWQQSGEDWKWLPFTKDVQVSCCGNSVCPDLAEALVSVNCQHLISKEIAA